MLGELHPAQRRLILATWLAAPALTALLLWILDL